MGEDNTNMQTEKKLHGMVLASLAAILSVVIFGLRFWINWLCADFCFDIYFREKIIKVKKMEKNYLREKFSINF